MREWIDLVEARLPRLPAGTYYHSSEARLPIGTILRPSGKNALDGDIAAILDDNRPAGFLPRSQYVFMVDRLEGFEHVSLTSEENLYAVRPSAEPIRCDHAWVNAIWSLVVRYEDTVMPAEVARRCAEYARNYWSGKLSWGRLDGNPTAIEFLARSAEVVKVIREHEIVSETMSGPSAPLYHATTERAAIQILYDGEILARGINYSDENDYVSLTRDPRLRYEWDNIGNAPVQFVVDQARLRQRHRLVPHSHFGRISTSRHVTAVDRALGAAHGRSESEERLYAPSLSLDFVTSIILHEPSEEIEALAAQRGIPVERR